MKNNLSKELTVILIYSGIHLGIAKNSNEYCSSQIPSEKHEDLGCVKDASLQG